MSRRQPRPPFPEQHLEKPGLEEEMDPRPRFEAPAYRAAGKLRGRVALITGGDSGIGRAVALLFAREGARVALVYLEAEQVDAEATRAAIDQAVEHDEAGANRVLLLPGDVRDASFCRSAVERTVEEFERLDILVNNAAYQQHRDGLEDIDEEQWDRTFRTNIYGYYHMAKAALPHLEAGACILNTGSITGLEGSGRLLDYAATKGAIHAFTKSLAQNLVPRGIRVNCVAPGPVWTPLNPAERPHDEVEDFGADTPYGRPAQPEEIAPAYVYFASNADSGFVTGEVLTILGGDTTAA
jgi:NAD(P)-dependent dehydrogenase (short-subunit alcohol dehydrogenase family)